MALSKLQVDSAAGRSTPAKSASTRLSPGEFEVCGLGVQKMVPSPTASAPQAMALERQAEMDAAAERAWPRLLQALRAQGEPRSTAVALMLDGQPMDPMLSNGAVPTDRPEAVLALTRLALQAKDPVIMRWAQAACAATVNQPACAGLNPRHWVQLEPDNAVAWLALRREGPLAEAEAMAGAARATKFDTGSGHIVGIVDRAIPPDVPAYLRFNITVAMLVRDSMSDNMDDVGWLIKRCLPSKLALDANLRLHCDAIARTMVRTARDLSTFVFGVGLGDRAGWPAHELQALKAEKAALMRSGFLSVFDLTQPHACESVRQLQVWAQSLDRQGELRSLRDQLKSLSSSVPGNSAIAP